MCLISCFFSCYIVYQKVTFLLLFSTLIIVDITFIIIYLLPLFSTLIGYSSIYFCRDADDAVHARDGYDYDGYRLRVEFPRGGGPGGFRGGRGGGGDRGRGSRGPPARRSQFRVLVTGLPPSGSWQDLKDHMREAGDVCFADSFKDGSGVVEFLRYEDMKYAIKKLDDSRFRSHEVCLEKNFKYINIKFRKQIYLQIYIYIVRALLILYD